MRVACVQARNRGLGFPGVFSGRRRRACARWRFARFSAPLDRTLGVALTLAWLSAPASAGAWLQPKGHGQIIVSSAFTDSARGFDAGGDPAAIPDYRKVETNAYVEYGLTDGVTAVLQPQLRSVTIGAPVDAHRFGLGYSDVGARFRIWSDDTSVVSWQGLVRIPGASDDSDPAQTGSTDFQFDARGLYGRSFSLGAWNSFLDAELGYRLRTGDAANEIRADLTVGTRPVPNFLLLAQSFNTFSQGAAHGVFSQVREHKVQVSVVWDVTGKWSLQVGGIATVAGENTLAERGAFAAIWTRF